MGPDVIVKKCQI